MSWLVLEIIDVVGVSLGLSLSLLLQTGPRILVEVIITARIYINFCYKKKNYTLSKYKFKCSVVLSTDLCFDGLMFVYRQFKSETTYLGLQ